MTSVMRDQGRSIPDQGKESQSQVFRKIANDIKRGRFMSDQLDSLDPDLHQQVADLLIEEGLGLRLLQIVDQMEKIDMDHVHDRLIETGQISYILDYLDMFPNADLKQIENELMNAGDSKGPTTGPYLLVEHRDKFPWIDSDQLVAAVVASSAHGTIAKAVVNSKELSSDTLDLLFKHHELVGVAVNPGAFAEVDRNEIFDRLLNADQVRYLVQNLKNFPEANQQPLLDQLFEQKRYHEIVHHLNDFNVDQSKLAEKLFDDQVYQLLAENIHKLESGLQEDVVDRFLITAEACVFLLEEIDSIKAVDHQDLVNKLFEYGKTQILARSIDKLSVDQQAVADRLLEIDPYALCEWLNRFTQIDQKAYFIKAIESGAAPGKAVNGIVRDSGNVLDADVAKAVLSKGNIRDLMRYVSCFHDLDQDVLQRIQGKIDKLVPQAGVQMFTEVCSNFRSFSGIDHEYLREMIRSASDKEKTAILNHWYNFPPEVLVDARGDLHGILDRVNEHTLAYTKGARAKWLIPFMKSGLIKKEMKKDEADQHLKQLRKAGLQTEAADFVYLYQSMGQTFNPEQTDGLVEAVTKESEQREDRPERRLEKEKRSVLGEMVQFYVYQLIDAHLPSERIAYWKYGVEPRQVRDRLQLSKFRGEVKGCSGRVFEWMRQYFVYAVNHEIQSQVRVDHPERSVHLPEHKNDSSEYNHIDQFVKTATTEEIRHYLFQSADRFEHEGWHSGYGGKPWSQIARTALDAWKDDANPAIMVDRFCDLEHNSGIAFDKQQDRYVLNSGGIKEFLDFKFKAKGDIDEWIKGLGDIDIPQDLKEKLKRKLKILKGLLPEIERMNQEFMKKASA